MKTKFNRFYDRYFKCRMFKCGGVCRFNLQDVSQNKYLLLTCPQCNKQWKASVNREKKICCGKIVIKFVSVEKNVAVRPLIYNETFRK